MLTKRGLGLVLFLALTGSLYSQSSGFYLNPAAISPNIINVTPVIAGELPADPMGNNSSQSIFYAFARTGGWGSTELGNVAVNCWYIPDGFNIFTKADNNTGPAQKNGLSNGQINVSSEYQTLIYNIQTTSLVSRVLTQSVKVIDFSKLSIGNYTVTLNYRLSY